jgi:hypothetical protein
MVFHRSVGAGALSHAYIIWGGSEADRAVFADQLAAAMVCSGTGPKPCGSCTHCDKAFRHIHPDIAAIGRNPDAREIYVDQIRALREDAVIMPNEASGKAYIINHADTMNVSAQNAILKLLEEPPVSSGFILLADNPAVLLPTVRSRCVELSADRHDTTLPSQIRDDAAAFIVALTGSPLKLAEFTFALEKYDKNEFAGFLGDAKSFLIEKMKDRLSGRHDLTPEHIMNALDVLDRAKEYLDLNVSLGHITGMMCAELIKADSSSRPFTKC